MATQRSRRRAGLSLRAEWEGLEELPVHFANQIVAVHDPVQNEFFINLGVWVPPAIMGSEEEQERQRATLQSKGTIKVRPLFRMGVSPQRLLEFISVLQTNYRLYQENVAKLEAEAAGNE